MARRQTIGRFAGMAIFVLVLILPTPLGATPLAMRAAAVTLLMATWWITEAIHISVTALIPFVLFPLLGILDAGSTAENYGHNYVLMLLGGFFIAKAFELHNLHRRTALAIIKRLGTSRRRIILSFMIATAMLSMWIANVAVTLLMLPIGAAVITREQDSAADAESSKFGLALMLAIAYAASVGGTGTLIGTPPNMVFAGMIKSLYPTAPEISFFQWMLVGIPLVILLLPATWFYIVKFYQICGSFLGSKEIIERELQALGPMTSAERRVLFVFILTGLGWIFRMAHLLDWKSAESVPWGVVLIVGGGYAIAKAFDATGFAAWVGQSVAFVGMLPIFLSMLSIVFFITFLTEINSNTDFFSHSCLHGSDEPGAPIFAYVPRRGCLFLRFYASLRHRHERRRFRQRSSDHSGNGALRILDEFHQHCRCHAGSVPAGDSGFRHHQRRAGLGAIMK